MCPGAEADEVGEEDGDTLVLVGELGVVRHQHGGAMPPEAAALF